MKAPFEINPLSDGRWMRLVEAHRCASVFHTSGWLGALRRTYGYQPVVFTTTPPDKPLRSGIPICRIESWVTGRRLVALPFSDHCEPLVEGDAELAELFDGLREMQAREGWEYIELRPQGMSLAAVPGFAPAESYWLHELDLSPGAATLFRNLHKDSIQRKVARAEREGLREERGRSTELLRAFYALLGRTRRRHQLPPQPLAWFENLAECLGDALEVRIARRGSQPVGSVLTLRFRDTVVYKYGASDERYHNLGGMPFLFWRTIEDAKRSEARLLDLGRTDLDNEGLATFKDRLGAVRRKITYWRSPAAAGRSTANGWKMRVARRVFTYLPQPLARVAGSLLYRHIG